MRVAMLEGEPEVPTYEVLRREPVLIAACRYEVTGQTLVSFRAADSDEAFDWASHVRHQMRRERQRVSALVTDSGAWCFVAGGKRDEIRTALVRAIEEADHDRR